MAEFVEDERGSGPIITGFAKRGFILDGRRADTGMLLTPEKLLPYDAVTVDQITLESLSPILDNQRAPEFVLLGTGPTLVFPAFQLRTALERQGIGLEVMDSRMAARHWGMLRSEERWIAAAILPFWDMAQP